MNINIKWLAISLAFFFIFYWILKAGNGWSFWGAIFIGWIFSRNRKKDLISKKEEPCKENYPSGEAINNAVQSEAERIRDLAEKKKDQAMKSGIPQLVDALYHDSIRYYPSWIRHTPRDSVPTIVTEAKEVDEKQSREECILLMMNGREYKFIHSTGNHEDSYWGDLEMFLNEEKVLHVSESLSEKEWGTEYYPNSVDAFIEGAWIKDFEILRDEIKKAEEEQKRKEFENPADIAKLKKSFGIE